MSRRKLNNMGACLRDWRGEDSIEILAYKVGVSRNTLGAYERGTSFPDVQFLVKFAEVTGAPLNLLMSCLLSDIPSEMAKTLADAISKSYKDKTKPFIPVDDEWFEPPRHHVPIGARKYQSVQIVDQLAFNKDFLEQHRIAAEDLMLVRMTGDYMAPTFEDGDLILFDAHIGDLLQNGVYALLINEQLQVRRIQTTVTDMITISCDNECYKPDTIKAGNADLLTVLGRAVWFGKSI